MAEKGLKRKVRALQTVATVSMAMMLFLLGGGGYLVVTAMRAGGSLQERATVHLFLNTAADSAVVASVGEELGRMKAEVKSYSFKSKEQALDEYQQAEGEDVVGFLQYNPLPDSYEIILNHEYVHPDSIAALDVRLSALNGVERVVYQRATMANLASNITKFNLVLLLFAGALLLVTLVLLGNTIRLTIHSRRQTISTMKLVGASRWFIMRSFVRESIVEGVVAWLLSGAMFWLLVSGLNEQLSAISATDRTVEFYILGAMFVIGVGVSLLFTVISVGKFVRMNSAKIEVY